MLKIWMAVLTILYLDTAVFSQAGGLREWKWRDNRIVLEYQIHEQHAAGNAALVLPFYVIGWSRAGMIAVMELGSGPGTAQTTRMRLRVVNLLNDRTVYDQTFYDSRLFEDPYWAFREFLPVFENELKDYGIAAGSAALGQFPLYLMGPHDSDIELSVKAEYDNLPVKNGQYISNVRLTAFKEAYGLETTASVIMTEKNPIRWRNFTAAGYIRSPFEERIAVICVAAAEKEDGTPYNELKLIGCHLHRGFKVRR